MTTPREIIAEQSDGGARAPDRIIAALTAAGFSIVKTEVLVASIQSTQETTMPKLTSKIAMELVTRIEGLSDQISAVYREAGEYDGMNNINAIRDIVKAREVARDFTFEADATLESLDLPDGE